MSESVHVREGRALGAAPRPNLWTIITQAISHIFRTGTCDGRSVNHDDVNHIFRWDFSDAPARVVEMMVPEYGVVPVCTGALLTRTSYPCDDKNDKSNQAGHVLLLTRRKIAEHLLLLLFFQRSTVIKSIRIKVL